MNLCLEKSGLGVAMSDLPAGRQVWWRGLTFIRPLC